MEGHKKVRLGFTIFTLTLIGVLLTAIYFYEGKAYSHENSGYTHESMPRCFGWEKMELNRRMCYLNEEQTECAYLIHNHGRWHVTEVFECPVREVEFHDGDSLCEQALPLNGEEEGCGG